MISKTIGCRGTLFSDKPKSHAHYEVVAPRARCQQRGGILWRAVVGWLTNMDQHKCGTPMASLGKWCTNGGFFHIYVTFYRRVHVSLCWTLIMSRRFLWWFPYCLGDIELGPSSWPVPPLRPRSFKHPWHAGRLQSTFGRFFVPHGKDGKSLSCFLGTFWWVGSSTAMFFERSRGSKKLPPRVERLTFHR